MVEQLTFFSVAADDPYAKVGEEGKDDEEEDGNHQVIVNESGNSRLIISVKNKT
jgi:hypothetical protein